jgi:hypothetical protein
MRMETVQFTQGLQDAQEAIHTAPAFAFQA